MLSGISAIGNPKSEALTDSLKYVLTPEETKIVRMVIEENKDLRNDVKDFKRIDSMQSSRIQSLEEELLNCDEQIFIKDNQISKLEHIPRVEIVESTEPWFENPFYTAAGFVLGFLTGYFLSK